MKTINVYDTDEQRIAEICEKNDITEAELIETLLDNCEDVLEFNGWRA